MSAAGVVIDRERPAAPVARYRKGLWLPTKMRGPNFYIFMVGQLRARRQYWINEARRSEVLADRRLCVRNARHEHASVLWYLKQVSVQS
ncbi:MAG TPA: hypothetical protein VFB54_07375 [Burkholderiales bacterium]|nr:hypothetical protein [Burkholderiales bacterium]